jgi:anti-sigma regulatory factor (Ser/Thr protein kinase)
MLSDILSVLRFATDPQTQNTLNAIASAASRKQPNWKAQVKLEQFKFDQSNWAMLGAFTNELFQNIKATNVSQTKLNRFKTIYTELVNNAYHHGCKDRSRWKIGIKCIYSRWFIQLAIKDDGKGFLVDSALKKVRGERLDGTRQGRSGLELVRDLSDSMFVDGKESMITIVVSGNDRIGISTTTEKHGKYNMLIVTWVDNDEWSFLAPDWEPLSNTLASATQQLIMIRFDTPSPTMVDVEMSLENGVIPNKKIGVPGEDEEEGRQFSTQEMKKARPIITECGSDKSHLFAYIISSNWVYEELKELETSNLRIFRTEPDARNWLLSNAKSYFSKVSSP